MSFTLYVLMPVCVLRGGGGSGSALSGLTYTCTYPCVDAVSVQGGARTCSLLCLSRLCECSLRCPCLG